MAKKLIRQKYIILLAVLFFLFLSIPVLWYQSPYFFRLIYYKNFSPDVYNKIIEDDKFDITLSGATKVYNFDNRYAIPLVIEWSITKKGNADIPADPRRSQSYKVKIKAELLIDGKVVSSVVSSKDVPLIYSKNLRTKKERRYFRLLRCDYPLRCKFSRECELKIDLIETDPRLTGLQGVLIVKPDTDI